MQLVVVVLLAITSVATGESTSDGSMADCGESAGLNMPKRNASCEDIVLSLLKKSLNAYGGNCKRGGRHRRRGPEQCVYLHRGGDDGGDEWALSGLQMTGTWEGVVKQISQLIRLSWLGRDCLPIWVICLSSFEVLMHRIYCQFIAFSIVLRDGSVGKGMEEGMS